MGYLIVYLSLAIIVLIYLIYNYKRKKVKTATYDAKTETMKVVRKDKRKYAYHGSATVWYRLPDFKRCSDSEEAELSRIYSYIKFYGNPYPDSYKK